MACDPRTASIFLEAANVTFGAEELSCITPVTGLTGGEYFEISSPNVDYYVWIDIDNLSTDPAVAGRTGIEVDVSSGYTASDYITAAITAIEAVQESGENVFRAEASDDGLSLSIEAIDVGSPLSALAAGDSTFTVEVERAGYGGSLGRTKEGIEVTFESTTFDVTANQTGILLLDQIIQGTGASVSAAFLELTTSRLSTIIGKGFGASLTPSGGTELIGFGTSKNFTSSFDNAGKLILHPVRLASTDRSKDVVIHKCVPAPESINYDGTETQALNVTFNALVDEEKDTTISLFAIGDWRQDIRA